MKVKLPGSRINEKSETTRLIVTATSGGAIYVGSEQIGIDRLSEKLRELNETSNENNLVIRADKTVQIDLVIKIIDAGKSIGIDKFTIETEKQK